MAGGVVRLSPARSKTLVGRMLPISQPIAEALARRRARRDPDSPLVFHRDGIPVRRWRTAWRTACQAAGVPTPLPPRLSAYCRAQPDPRQRSRMGCHAPDRAQEPRHLRPLQHHPRAGTARRRRPAGRLSGAAGAGGASPSAAPRGRPRRPAHRITPPPRTTRHRVRAHGPQVRSGPRSRHTRRRGGPTPLNTGPRRARPRVHAGRLDATRRRRAHPPVGGNRKFPICGNRKPHTLVVGGGCPAFHDVDDVNNEGAGHRCMDGRRGCCCSTTWNGASRRRSCRDASG